MAVGIGDVTDGELPVGEVAQETADGIDGVAACGRVVDGRRLGAQPDVDEQPKRQKWVLFPRSVGADFDVAEQVVVDHVGRVDVVSEDHIAVAYVLAGP